MDRHQAIAVLNREAHRVLALAAAEGTDLTVSVPSCPGWDFAALVKHLGNAYNWVASTVEGRHADAPASDLARRPEGMSPPEWMAGRLDRMLTALQEVPAETPIWNFGPDSPGTVEFWWRRMAHETAIHRVDTELAASVPVSTLEPEIAADMVSELFTILRFTDVTDHGPGAERPAAGASHIGEKGGPGLATLHLHATDAEGAEWTLDTVGRTLTRRHNSGDVAVRGAAWALARWCWGRPATGELEVFGDLSSAEAWRSTVVP